MSKKRSPLRKFKRRKPPKNFEVHKTTIIIKLPRDVRDGFKAYCARRGISMRQRIEELMIGDINTEINTVQRAKSLRRNLD